MAPSDQPARCASLLDEAKDSNAILAALRELRSDVNGCRTNAYDPKAHRRILCLDDWFLDTLKIVFDPRMARVKQSNAEDIDESVVEEVFRLLIELLLSQSDGDQQLVAFGFHESALEIIDLDISESLFTTSMTFIKQSLYEYTFNVEINVGLIRRVTDYILKDAACLRPECEATCPYRMCFIHLDLCSNIIDIKPTSLSDAHIKKLVIVLCTRLSNEMATDAVAMVTKMLVQMSYVRENVLVATVDEYSFVPAIVSLLSRDDVDIRKGAMRLIESLLTEDYGHLWATLHSQFLSYLPVILLLSNDKALMLLGIIAAEDNNIVQSILDFDVVPYFAYWLQSNDFGIASDAADVLLDVLYLAKEQIFQLLAFDRHRIVSSVVDLVYRCSLKSESSDAAADCLVKIMEHLIETRYTRITKDNPWYIVAKTLLETKLLQSVKDYLAVSVTYDPSLDILNDELNRLHATITIDY